jgi:hypothetical protein
LSTSHHRSFRLAAAILGVAVVGAGCSAIGSSRSLSFAGPDDSAQFNAETIETLRFEARDDGDEQEATVEDLIVLLDGDDVTGDAERDDVELVYAPRDLPDGERTVAFAQLPAADEDDETADPAEPEVVESWTFAVNTTPPDLEVTSPEGAVIAGDPLTVAGMTDPGATIEFAGQETTAGDDGSFELNLDQSPEGALALTATDPAGNTTTDEFALVTVPSRVEIDEVRTVHVSFYGWAGSLREPILEMIDDGKINAVQLDLKDEGGQIGYDSDIPLAQEIGASQGIFDLEAAVAELHERDVAVVGRIVAFADPILVNWAWENDERDWVIQLPDGSAPYTGSYAGFSNYTHPEVLAYNIDVAQEAAAAGVDHILWDYIRRPDGSLDNMEVPGLETTPEEAIVDFARQADERLAGYGIQHGASVYGIAADRPTQIGQDIPAMSEHLDYVAPMIYPSHWGPGEYGVADPNRQPYDIVQATLEVWEEATEGTRARVVPWLEDTNYRAWDRHQQVREQIRGARDMGIDEWMMWDPNVNYTTGAYEARD